MKCRKGFETNLGMLFENAICCKDSSRTSRKWANQFCLTTRQKRKACFLLAVRLPCIATMNSLQRFLNRVFLRKVGCGSQLEDWSQTDVVKVLIVPFSQTEDTFTIQQLFFKMASVGSHHPDGSKSFEVQLLLLQVPYAEGLRKVSWFSVVCHQKALRSSVELVQIIHHVNSRPMGICTDHRWMPMCSVKWL